ncbi:unnamed protein product [Closterium sp. NIES-54]
MFRHIKDLVELDDSGPKAWKLLRDVIQPNTLSMVIVLEKELAALSMRPGDDQCTKIISVLDNSWDNLIPTLNTQQDQWTPEWLRRQILQEDFRRRPTGGGAANETAEGYGAAGGSRGRGGGRGRGRGRGFGRGRGQGDYNEGHGSSGGRGSTRMEGACWYCKKAEHPWFKCFSRLEGWAPPGMKPPSDERARGGAVQGSGAQGKTNPGMFLMVEDVKGSEGDVGSVGKIKFVASTSGALLPVTGVGNAKVMGANGGLVGLGNVLLVEGLSTNLLSVRRLQKSKAKVTFGPTSCRAKLGKLLLWDMEERNSYIKDLRQLPIIPWNGKPSATAAAAATAKATTGGEETAPTDGALDAVKKVQQTQQPHGEVLAGVDATGAWAKASSGSGEADWETWHERLCHVNFPMLQKLVKDGSLKGLEAVLKKKGIQHQLTVPYNPQQNGVAERFNRTLQEGARTLLGRAGLPDPFWVTALRQVALVKNRVLATVGDKQWVPYTKWYGSAPAVNMLRAYGCMVVFHDLYMLQPEGLDDGSGRVCRLKKAIYGLKQAPRAWYHKLEETLLAGGFKKSECEHSLSLLQEKEQFLMLLVYVDDILLFFESDAMIEHVEEMLEMQFKCSKMVDVKYYLGMHVERDLDNAVRQRQQRGATNLGKGEMLLTCYTDASFNSVKADGTSIGGYVCLFGGGAVSWCSKKQNEVGLSSCETEYMALHHGVKEVVWLRRLLEEIGVCQRELTLMFCDNESAVKLAKNACLHGLTKHIRPKWHWVRRLLDKEVWLERVKSQHQAADILTKRLAENEHWKGMKLAGMSVH